MAGILISFDGLDSSGKATQTRLLTEHLTAKGIYSAIFRSPDYETESGKELKLRLQGKLGNWHETIWQEKMGYFAANRAEHKEEVQSMLDHGGVIVYDRYVPSSVAFITVEASAGTVTQELREEVRQAVEGLEYTEHAMPKEDVSIFFDIPPKIAIDLLKGRKHTLGEEDEYTDYLSVQEALHEEYVQMAQKNPEHMLRIPCMDGDRLRSIEEIASLVREALQQKFPEYNHYFL